MEAATPASAAASEDTSASSIVFCPTSGFHLLKIDGYSRTKGMPNNHCITSRNFSLGGHRSWSIDLYPNGRGRDNAGYMSVFLRSNTSDLKAQYGISIVDSSGTSRVSTRGTYSSFWSSSNGHERFFKNKDLEQSRLLVDDCFTIKVDIAVQGEFPVRMEQIAVAQALLPPPKLTAPSALFVPPAACTASLQRHLGDLLSSKEGADVTFMVGDEAFAAHRCILAARSPVFKAQLFGAMKESTGARDDAVRIEDMAPQVFEALLYFLYTECLTSPESEKTPQEQDVTMTQHLLVAADRYDLDKLKLICEETLCECIDSSNAVTILALAEQHNCAGLKQACLNFIRSTTYV
ncbi:BTB/POZ and MATH domain-containing protein 3 [Brachypodium distachyon]|uniref:BTB domain-containing protein n=1 Tax=Brachypodium distachyon TaxID=15368 RepID=A0A0Q3IZL0_BRADI|nr:BTB/POZ and MATH domain-containing protein 3 [Brachypodium distachyon]KQK11131.1 hypothetical protein BRADI_2g58317v3 [Brachypodium distachyon]|eukprot:XP_003567382.1 BTB/POZ and MATH domain-containing protein 3 [Brachypodium distachyon]